MYTSTYLVETGLFAYPNQIRTMNSLKSLNILDTLQGLNTFPVDTYGIKITTNLYLHRSSGLKTQDKSYVAMRRICTHEYFLTIYY